jgi:nucleotide-binding universal stress UspA family protein
MRTILVAIDESEATERVVDFVNRFFTSDERIVGINVAPRPTPWVPPSLGWGGLYSWGHVNRYASDPLVIDEQRHHAEAAATATVLRAGLEGADTKVEFGDPVAAIDDAAHEVDAELIVVGAGHRNLLQRMFTRSVSKGLVDQADRPVLVVR